RQEPGFAAELRREPVAPAPPFVPAAAPETPPQPPAAPLPALDQDSLADLIAAELASDIDAEAPQASEAAIAPSPIPDAPVRDNDVFGVPPVFGLGSAQPAPPPQPVAEPEKPMAAEPAIDDVIAQAQAVSAPVEPKGEPDPLDEIERLIGPAVRGEHRSPAPSPALRSLATPTLPPEPTPAPASEKLRSAPVASVDDAILAAAATSGARVEWVEPEISARIADVEEDVAPRARNNRVLGMTRSLAGPLVAMLLLAVAAVGLYAVLGLGSGTPDGPAPLLMADTAPIKEVPTPDPEASQASQSVVFNEIAGGNTGEGEQLVSRDQADVEEVNGFVPSTGTDEGLVNRKVRTVTVRPDGTIVSGSEGVAGATMLPVDRPSVPDVPGADFSTPELIGSVDPSATAAENAAAQAIAAAPAVVPVRPGSFVPAVDLTGKVIAGKTAPVPLVRPANLPSVAATTPQAAAPATPTQSSAVASSVNSAPAYVQLSSQRTEEAARQTAQTIASRFGPLFGGASLEVQRVDLGERGIFYRVRVPADSLQSAITLCNNVKAAGGDCFTM
ncbi:MAG: SPOR domain-containing protein, partial [Devosia sp.]|nr:SPOR domain-containing protein [Devosia sp.]